MWTTLWSHSPAIHQQPLLLPTPPIPIRPSRDHSCGREWTVLAPARAAGIRPGEKVRQTSWGLLLLSPGMWSSSREGEEKKKNSCHPRTPEEWGSKPPPLSPLPTQVAPFAWGAVCVCVDAWLCVCCARESVAVLDTGLGGWVRAVPLLCMGHQISHSLPLGLNFLICELGIISLEDWASKDHCEALRALCEQDRASPPRLFICSLHLSMQSWASREEGWGESVCLGSVEKNNGPSESAASLWPQAQGTQEVAQLERLWSAGPYPWLLLWRVPSGDLGDAALRPPPAGPLDLSQGPDEELPLQVGDLCPHMGLHS